MLRSERHWTRWYSLSRWQRMRKHQLRKAPLCEMCARRGKVEIATVVDHVEKHFGDPVKFWTGKLQSCCRDCHEGDKKYIEARGYHRDVDASGWPSDPNHPANLPRTAFRRFGFSIPHNVRPSAIPVTLVCGPPAAGKTTWVNARKRHGDTVISLDDCKVRVGGRMWDNDRKVVRRALALRDSMLRALATAQHGHAFVVVGAPTAIEREAWCRALGVAARFVVVLDTAADVCIERLNTDPERAHAVAELTNGVKRWWHHYGKDRGTRHATPDTPLEPMPIAPVITPSAPAPRELCLIG